MNADVIPMSDRMIDHGNAYRSYCVVLRDDIDWAINIGASHNDGEWFTKRIHQIVLEWRGMVKAQLDMLENMGI